MSAGDDAADDGATGDGATGDGATGDGAAGDGAQDILVRLAEPPACARCAGPSLLHVRFRHSWRNNRGERVPGIREAVLCPSCDGGAGPAGALHALCTARDRLGAADAPAFAALVTAWVESLRGPHPDPGAHIQERDL